MTIDRAWFRRHPCFQSEWSGFDRLSPINIIVGRNNTGKSRLADLVEELCKRNTPLVASGRTNPRWEFRFSAKPTVAFLQSVFSPTAHDGLLPGNHWHSHGVHLQDSRITWSTQANSQPYDVEIEPSESYLDPRWEVNLRARIMRLSGHLHTYEMPYQGHILRRIKADRDIVPESREASSLDLDADGKGASRIVSRFLLDSEQSYPRSVVQQDLRTAMNQILAEDGHIDRIETYQHSTGKTLSELWEVYLEQPNKGPVSLSDSGSGLKTILLVLLNLLAVPHLRKGTINEKQVLVFEELENNLHPALLRRLVDYIERYVYEKNWPLFLTTHSGVVIDALASAPTASVVQVSHDRTSGRTKLMRNFLEHVEAIRDIGARPSDLLQANGIIWLEGPSDRIYMNRWIELASSGSLREGRHYQCAFYAGALSSHVEFVDPEESLGELTNLLTINPNVAFIADSDRGGLTDPLKNRTTRIVEELRNISGARSWITAGREIENYIPIEVLGQLGANVLPVNEFEHILSTDSKLATIVRRNGIRVSSKVELARRVSPKLSIQNMSTSLDWSEKIAQICADIRRWNGLQDAEVYAPGSPARPAELI